MTIRITFLSLLMLVLLSDGNSQDTSKGMDNNKTNPLLCNPEVGICEIPGNNAANGTTSVPAVAKPVKIIYFTDPICSSCWGIEPQLRRLKLEYANSIEIEYHMGGLLPDWSYNSGGISKPSDVAHHWDEVSLHYDMPIDGDVWLEDPLDSSYPPSIAFKAAQMQDAHKAILFLREIRHMVFLEKKNITKWEHLSAAAVATGLDTAQLKHDYDNDARKAFQQDLELGRKLGVRGFPTLLFSDTSGNQVKVYGVKPYQQFENAVMALHPEALKIQYVQTWEGLFAQYPTLTTHEYAVLSGVDRQSAEQQLLELEKKGNITRYSTKNGVLWRVK